LKTNLSKLWRGLSPLNLHWLNRDGDVARHARSLWHQTILNFRDLRASQIVESVVISHFTYENEINLNQFGLNMAFAMAYYTTVLALDDPDMVKIKVYEKHVRILNRWTENSCKLISVPKKITTIFMRLFLAIVTTWPICALRTYLTISTQIKSLRSGIGMPHRSRLNLLTNVVRKLLEYGWIDSVALNINYLANSVLNEKWQNKTVEKLKEYLGYPELLVLFNME